MLLKINDRSSRSARVAVIGAGPAGMAAAVGAASLGLEVDWYEKETRPGGKLNDYHQLFPDRQSAAGVLVDYDEKINTENIHRFFGTAVTAIRKKQSGFTILNGDQLVGSADSVIMATGFDFFDARLKEEFGYGIYPHVITSVDLERLLRENPEALRRQGGDPSTVAFVHCVGSRDQQIGNGYCSRLCCITGIKQAIELREKFPSARIFNFYIDMRAFGNGYEELFREAQEKYKIRFVRGRVSEAAEDRESRIILKAEDTLMARPLKLTADWLVLLVGMVPSCTRVDIHSAAPIDSRNGFLLEEDGITGGNLKDCPGIFAAGTCCGPRSIPESISAGRSAALQAFEYIKNS